MRKNLRIAFTMLILLASSVVTVATSKKRDYVSPESLARKEYYVASNCPQAITQDQVVIDNELIESPANRSFYNYGLPTYNLNLTFTTQIIENMNGVQRTCIRAEQNYGGTPLIVYTCSEYGQAVCQVSFEAIQ
ncbi:hypothetical protein [Bdellovibrio sp. HCB337]|uniref:hypothetical protein n=1 Tax=Bdellovibrio sp. HCB337 TaxID=3394358 RepID=UPI0039A52347